MTQGLFKQRKPALTNPQTSLEEHATVAAVETDRVKTELESDQATQTLRSNPALREVFARATAAIKALPKQEAAASSERARAFAKIQAALAQFRTGATESWPR